MFIDTQRHQLVLCGITGTEPRRSRKCYLFILVLVQLTLTFDNMQWIRYLHKRRGER